MKKKLQKIFNHYNKKYKLNFTLTVTNKPTGGAGACCNYDGKTIKMNCKQVENYYFKDVIFQQRIGKINFNKFPIFVLLHELGHAIEEQKNPEEYRWKYFSFSGNYHSHPLELQADNFAKKELKKWT